MKLFDVFVRRPDGRPVWIEAVGDLATATRRAIRFSECFEGESFIFSEKEGVIVKRIDHAQPMHRAA